MEISSLNFKMLPLKNRLKREREIERVFREKRSVRERSIVLKKIENLLKESRVCFIVPGEISKKATVRNRIKRRMREVVRENLPKIKKGFDIVLIALPGIEKKSFREFKKDLLKVLLKAKVVR